MNIEEKLVNKHESRKGYAPIAIVDHISAGTMGSMYNTFANPKSKQASSHFGISREGNIVQYVDLERAAWTQGRIQAPTADVIKTMGKVNPNLYCVSIEHEGYVEGHKDENGETVVEYFGLYGDITKEQIIATCWLHKYIQVEVEKIFGNKIPLNSTNVIGHYQIDSIGKPFCPGPRFPWTRLYSELAVADRMTLEEYDERLDYLMSDNNQTKEAFEIYARVDDLYQKATNRDGKYSEAIQQEARRKLSLHRADMVERGWL